MDFRRIALYVALLTVGAIAVFFGRQPLVAAMQARAEANERAEQERALASVADWSIAFATRAADSDDPRQRIMAARALRALRHTQAIQVADGRRPAHTDADLARFEARADALARDLLAASDDELVLWLLAVECGGSLGPCDRARAVQRLREAAGDNASVQIVALGQAADAEGKREALAAAARATRDTSYWMPALDAVLAMQDAVPMPAEVRAGLDTDSDAVARLVMAFSQVLALPIPTGPALAGTCLGDSVPADDPAWKADCVATARVLVKAEENLVNYVLGLRVLRRLLEGSDEEVAIVERLREREWLMAQQRLVPAADEYGYADLEPWVADWRHGGELHAMREKLRRANLALVPPRGWMPDRPEVLDP
jgi:hypothetical protein